MPPVRAMFVEQNPTSFDKLRTLCGDFDDVETQPHQGEFEEKIAEAVQFAKKGPNPFAFTFIDPTGWTGYGLKRIAPLLRVEPGEVLVNFMTKDISRFIDHETSTALGTFVDLYGDASYASAWRGLSGLDREDAIVETYCDRLRSAGGFRYVVSAAIFNPMTDRTHYHLIYGTRSDVGLITFREIETKAVAEQRSLRADVRASKRESTTGQGSLFVPEVLDTNYVGALAARYAKRAEAAMMRRLELEETVPYDALVIEALQYPMSAEKGVKEWLRRNASEGRLEILGLARNERVPKRRRNHRIRRVLKG